MSGTIMFIHGMFLNPKSWEHWTASFERDGFRCIAPAWPLHEGDPADLRERVPAGLGELSLDTVLERLEEAARPHEDLILVGHSVGGLLVQLMIQRGIGRMGVTICPVAPNRMLSLDAGFFRNSPSIANPFEGDTPCPMDADAFFQTFGNTMSRAESDAAHARYAMHESRNVLRDCLGETGHIDLERPHAPLLFIAADKDEIIPADLCEKNAEAYADRGSRTDYIVLADRGHFICGQPGWQEVTGHVVDWIGSVRGDEPGRPLLY